MVRIIDEATVFQINNIEEQVFEEEDIRVVVVDNFYKNPDLILDLINTIPASTHTPNRRGFPGNQIDITYNMNFLLDSYIYLIQKYFPDIVSDEYLEEKLNTSTFMVNVLKYNPSIKEPHIDIDGHFASGIYFNKECTGGTAFYSKVTREMLGIVEMKYNRMILYKQDSPHTAHIEEGTFADTYRISQQLFI
tara:strand:+ start:119 stop:694 length:576 start_codon:yes stop_codon:yes gene_type:complete